MNRFSADDFTAEYMRSLAEVNSETEQAALVDYYRNTFPLAASVREVISDTAFSIIYHFL